jgi:hypothetical protein
MKSTDPYLSIYDQRVRLVAETITANSELDATNARELAVHVLHALDHIPEKVR